MARIRLISEAIGTQGDDAISNPHGLARCVFAHMASDLEFEELAERFLVPVKVATLAECGGIVTMDDDAMPRAGC